MKSIMRTAEETDIYLIFISSSIKIAWFSGVYPNAERR